MLWIARTGSPWSDLSAALGPWNSIYVRFARWADKNVWQNILAVLGESADFEQVFIDSPMVRVHQHAAGAAKKKGGQAPGRSRGGLKTKTHACVEGLGHLARFTLTGGQVAYITQPQTLIEQIQPGAVLADKAYDADALLAYIDGKDAKGVIPPKTNRKNQRVFNKHQYRNRNLIERFFVKLKQFRRGATRYDKRDSRFASFIALAASVIWLQ